MITKEDLKRDLLNLGIREGDILFLRISYHAIGKIEGGPKVFIEALLDVVNPERGTIIATCFPKRFRSAFRLWNKKDKIYNPASPPKPVTGVISVMMSEHEQSFRSRNTILPFVAIGKDAENLMMAYDNDTDLYLPILKAAEMGGKCLRIGGKVLIGTTHLSLTNSFKRHGLYQIRIPVGNYTFDNGKYLWHDKTPSLFCSQGFENFYNKFLRNQIVLQEGLVGKGSAYLTSLSKSLELESRYLNENPKIMLCDNPDCYYCRVSYSFSEIKSYKYIFNQLYKFIRNPQKKYFHNAYNAFITSFLGKKCQ